MLRQDKTIKVLSELGEPQYRLDQINRAIYKNGVISFDEMTSLAKPLRNSLKEALGDLTTVKPLATSVGQDVEKVLFETTDGNKIESVWMNYNPEFSTTHESLCISSQAGCALKCAFCYTGTIGFKKNLTADEITDQVRYFIKNKNFKGSISFMGMGEPFANLANVFTALQYLTDEKMFGIGQRKINISTVGVIPGIIRLTEQFPQVNLAFSLHTPFQDQRLELMPITKAYGITEVLEVLDQHILKTHRKVFIAYILMDGVNDSEDHALALAALINARRKDVRYLYHVSLIRFHGEEEEMGFKAASKEKIKAFTKVLTAHNINNTVRQSFGLDIKAACGQLCAKE